MRLYTDIDLFVCEVLRARIADGGLPPGDVWTRDIRTLTAADMRGYRQVHLFAGIGGSPLGLKWAGWPDDWSVVTGGFPCQDISVAGKGAGINGARSGLWGEMHRVICYVRPKWVIVENVPALRTRGIDRVLGDLEGLSYEAWPLVVGADDVGAPHRRKRVWIVGRCLANAERDGRGARGGVAGDEGRKGVGRGQSARGGELAHAASGGFGADRGPREGAGRADECCPFCSHQFDITRLGKYGCPNCYGEGLGDASGTGRQERDAARFADPARQRGWPASPGQPQRPWEAPRLAQWEVGGSTDGIPGRLARFANRHALRALGNAQVPQVVELIARAIIASTKEKK